MKVGVPSGIIGSNMSSSQTEAQILALLRGPRDEERFVGLLMVTKHMPNGAAGNEDDIRRRRRAFFDAIGSSFLIRLFQTEVLKKGGGEDGGVYLTLAAGIMSYFCADSTIACEFHALLPQILAACPAAAEGDTASIALVDDLLRCAGGILATSVGSSPDGEAEACGPCFGDEGKSLVALVDTFKALRRRRSSSSSDEAAKAAKAAKDAEATGANTAQAQLAGRERMQLAALDQIRAILSVAPHEPWGLTSDGAEALAVALRDDQTAIKFAALRALLAHVERLDARPLRAPMSVLQQSAASLDLSEDSGTAAAAAVVPDAPAAPATSSWLGAAEAGLGQVLQSRVGDAHRDAALRLVAALFGVYGSRWLSRPPSGSGDDGKTKAQAQGTAAGTRPLGGADLVQVCVRFVGIELRILVDSYCRHLLPDGMPGSGGGGEGPKARPAPKAKAKTDTESKAGDAASDRESAAASASAAKSQQQGVTEEEQGDKDPALAAVVAERDVTRMRRMLPVCYRIVEEAVKLLLAAGDEYGGSDEYGGGGGGGAAGSGGGQGPPITPLAPLAFDAERAIRLHGALVDCMAVVLQFVAALSECWKQRRPQPTQPPSPTGTRGTAAATAVAADAANVANTADEANAALRVAGAALPEVLLATARMVGTWFVEETDKLQREFKAVLPFLVHLPPLPTSGLVPVASAAASATATARTVDPFEFLIPALTTWVQVNASVRRQALETKAHWRAMRSVVAMIRGEEGTLRAACRALALGGGGGEGGGGPPTPETGTFVKLACLCRFISLLVDPDGFEEDDEDEDDGGEEEEDYGGGAGDEPALLEEPFVKALPPLAEATRLLGACVRDGDGSLGTMHMAADSWTEAVRIMAQGLAEWCEAHGGTAALVAALATVAPSLPPAAGAGSAADEGKQDSSRASAIESEAAARRVIDGLLDGAVACFMHGCRSGIPGEHWEGLARYLARCLPYCPRLRSRMLQPDALQAALELNASLPEAFVNDGDGGGEDDEEERDSGDAFRAQNAAGAVSVLLAALQLSS